MYACKRVSEIDSLFIYYIPFAAIAPVAGVTGALSKFEEESLTISPYALSNISEIGNGNHTLYNLSNSQVVCHATKPLP